MNAKEKAMGQHDEWFENLIEWLEDAEAFASDLEAIAKENPELLSARIEVYEETRSRLREMVDKLESLE